jgi:hypothetical protein
VSGPTVSSSSITEPGQPWVMISGSASGCGERTWMKWISTPSISVTNCGRALSRASAARQLYPVAQWRASASIVASWTPCERSATSSRPGNRVAAMRLRSSSRSWSGKRTVNGRIAVVPADGATVVVMVSLLRWVPSRPRLSRRGGVSRP